MNQATQCDLDRLVDGDLRVQSIENLFVVDASVIPRITTGSINAAVVAIAETWRVTCSCEITRTNQSRWEVW